MPSENNNSMTTTVTIQDANILINGLNIEALLSRVYNQGKEDQIKENQLDKVTFITLSKELKDQGRNISSRTLSLKAKEANVKVFRFDGNKLAVNRKDLKYFIN